MPAAALHQPTHRPRGAVELRQGNNIKSQPVASALDSMEVLVSVPQGCMVGASPWWVLFLTTVDRVAELCSLKHCAKRPSGTSTHILRRATHYHSARPSPLLQAGPEENQVLLSAAYITPPAIPKSPREEALGLTEPVILQAWPWPAGLPRKSLPNPGQRHGQHNAVFWRKL